MDGSQVLYRVSILYTAPELASGWALATDWELCAKPAAANQGRDQEPPRPRMSQYHDERNCNSNAATYRASRKRILIGGGGWLIDKDRTRGAQQFAVAFT